MSALLKGVRKEHKEVLEERFFSRIGKKSTCETYQIRSHAVENGLGWATANNVLDRALKAFQTRIKIGLAPDFSIGSEKTKDSLRIQFVQAGGCPVGTLFEGGHSGLILKAPAKCGKRKYGEFSFRLGAATASAWATGTCYFHREIPKDATIASAALVRERVGKDFKYFLQNAFSIWIQFNVVFATLRSAKNILESMSRHAAVSVKLFVSRSTEL